MIYRMYFNNEQNQFEIRHMRTLQIVDVFVVQNNDVNSALHNAQDKCFHLNAFAWKDMGVWQNPTSK